MPDYQYLNSIARRYGRLEYVLSADAHAFLGLPLDVAWQVVAHEMRQLGFKPDNIYIPAAKGNQLHRGYSRKVVL